MPEHDNNWHILVHNLYVEGEGFSLGPSVWIRPLANRLTVFKLAGLGAMGFREWAVLEPLLDGLRSEIVSIKDGSVISGYDHLNRGWLALALLCLRGYTSQVGVACSDVSWDRAEETRKSIGPSDSFDGFAGCLLDYHLKRISISSKANLSIDDADWVAQHFERFNSLSAQNEAFRFSLEAAVDWRYSKDMRSAIARIWAGVESILAVKTEIVFRLSAIAASLLVPRGQGRVERFRAIKKLYDVRSKAVHGAPLKPEILATALNDSSVLLSSLLLLCIEKGRVFDSADFESALLG
jgi:hypothetical protein